MNEYVIGGLSIDVNITGTIANDLHLTILCDPNPWQLMHHSTRLRHLAFVHRHRCRSVSGPLVEYQSCKLQLAHQISPRYFAYKLQQVDDLENVLSLRATKWRPSAGWMVLVCLRASPWVQLSDRADYVVQKYVTLFPSSSKIHGSLTSFL